jgi:hypothetical protein
MSRIIVVPDSAHPMLEGCLVLTDGKVQPEHVRDGRSADRLIERVAAAARDASHAGQRVAIDRGRRAVWREQ